MILSNALILPVLQLQTQQVMMSLIPSHIEYLTDLSYCAHIVVEVDEKFSLNCGLKYHLMMIGDSWGLLFGPPCISLCTSGVRHLYYNSNCYTRWSKNLEHICTP